MGLFDDNSGDQSDEQLNSIIENADIPPETRSLAGEVQRQGAKLQSVGLNPGDAEPRKSFFGQVLDTLDAPKQGIEGVLDAALNGDMFTGDVGTGWRRGQQRDISFSDILRDHGRFQNPIFRGVAGFVGDTLLDPLTYLTLGESVLSKGSVMAGRALAPAGEALAKEGIAKLSAMGITDAYAQSEHMDNIFSAIGKYKDSESVINKVSKPISESGSILDGSSSQFNDAATAMGLPLKQMADAQDVFSQLYSTDQIAGVSDIFAKKALHIGADIPFLGHLIGNPAADAAKETIINDPGVVGKAFRFAGKVLSPGRLDIANIEMSPQMVDAVDNVRMFANEQVGKIGAALGSLKDVPVLGAGIQAGEALGKRAASAFTAATDTLQKIFAYHTLIPASANRERLNFLDVKAGNRVKATEKVTEALGLENARDVGLMKASYLDLDGLNNAAMSSVIKENNPELLAAINRMRTTGVVLDGDRELIRQSASAVGPDGLTPEMGFRQGLANYLANPNIPAERKEIVQRVVGSMDDLSIEESQKGINHGFVEYYLPHRYTAIGDEENKVLKAGGQDYLKERTYPTIGDAFTSQGYVGKTYLPDLLQNRWSQGLNGIAAKQYYTRLAIENGLPADRVQAMYKEAMQNPGGAAEQVLANYKVNVKPLDKNLLAEGAYIKDYQDYVGKVGKGDLDAGRIIADGGAQMSQKTREEIFAAGARPLDNHLPNAFLGEIGDRVTLPGYEDLILPKAIADSYKETVAARDIIKDKFGGSRFGKATIDTLDYANGVFKKWVTLPFPGYWAGNFLGDRFRNMMLGVNSMSPGLHARVLSTLKGDSAIVNKLGMTLDKPTLERVIKNMGVNYSVNDALGTVEAFSKTNIDKLISQRDRGGLANLFSTEKGSKLAALAQANDKFQKLFDGHFRVTQLVHRFEQGDSLTDAVRNASNAYFNYRDMSPVESSVLRRFYMFYGYMSKATKTSLTSLVTSPGDITQQMHGVSALSEFFSDPKAAPTWEDHDMRLLSSAVNSEQLSKVIGKSENGTPIFARGFQAPLNSVMQQFSLQTPRNFSVSEILSAGIDSAQRTAQKQFATANPAINAAAQFISGKNLYFGKPLNAEFLRKVPDLTEAADRLSHLSHTEIPTDINDTVKSFLKAVPDGKDRLIADPSRMWIMTNLIPGMGRMISTGGAFANADIPTPLAAARALSGINIADSDVSRSYLYDRKNNLDKMMVDSSVKQRLKNLASDGE